MNVLAAILFLSLIGYLDACQCQANQTVKYDISSAQISEPSNSGTFGDTSCAPIDCTSTITITPPDSGQMYGGNITIIGCDGLNGDNYLVVYSGDQVVRNFTSCPNTPYYLAADTSNIINFSFHIKNNISFTGFVFPIPAIAPPTTPPTVATTTPYTTSSSTPLCRCQRDQNVTYNIKSLIFGNPTVGGMFGDTPCGPADCSTRIGITFPTDYLYFSQIKIVECHNFADGDFFTFFSGGQLVQNFTSCPTTLPFFLTADTLDNNLYFHVQNTVSFTAFLFPTKNNFTETTTLIPTTFPVTTTISKYYPVIADIVFMFDNSQSFTQAQFTDTANFILNALQPFNIGYNKTFQVALISILGDNDRFAYTVANLDGIYDYNGLRNGLNNAFQPDGPNSGTGNAALEQALRMVMGPNFKNRGYRPSINNHLIAYITAVSTPNPPSITQAQAILNSGDYKIVAISYQGDGSNTAALTSLTGKAGCVLQSSTQADYTGAFAQSFTDKIFNAYQNGGNYC